MVENPRIVRVLIAVNACGILLVLCTACAPIARPGSWHLVGSLSSISQPDKLVSLPDGRALLIAHGQAAVFNSTKGTWRAATPPPEVLAAPGAVALPDGTVLVFGGRVANKVVSDALIYRPDDDRWERSGSLTTPRYGFAAAVMTDGRVFVAGGGDAEKKALLRRRSTTRLRAAGRRPSRWPFPATYRRLPSLVTGESL